MRKNRAQRHQGFQKDKEEKLKDVVQDLKELVSKLQRENRELKKRALKAQHEIKESERDLRRNMKNINVKDIFKDYEEHQGAVDPHFVQCHCPKCNSLLLDKSLPFGTMYICTGAECDYRRVER
jgi:chromosome segregation ATPase